MSDVKDLSLKKKSLEPITASTIRNTSTHSRPGAIISM